MKKLLFSLSLVAALVFGVNSFAIFPQDTFSQALLTRANNYDPLPGIGNVINKTKNLLRCTYDFSVLGGAATTIGLLDDQGNAAILPKGAIVTNAVVNVLTAMSQTTSSVLFTVLSGGDVVALKAPSSYITGGTFVAGVPVGTAATWVGPVTATMGTHPSITISQSVLTAGKLELFLEYVIQ